MSKRGIETYHEDGEWKNKVQGSSRASTIHGTKAAAEAKGRAMAKARGVEHVIKNQDGTIGAKNSYGNDPRNVPG